MSALYPVSMLLLMPTHLFNAPPQIEPTLATAIQENLGIPCRSDETIREITRGIRQHFVKFVKPLAGGGLEQAQLGLGHSYSRSKVRIF